MLTRIVKMSFKENEINAFLENFNNHKLQIRNFEGCHLLELFRDQNNTSTFFTYSYWKSAQHLENYRNSTLFKIVWAKTKVMFKTKPEAWSLDKVEIL